MADDRILIHVLGDSHAWVFDHFDEDGVELPGTELSVVGVGGATAFGLANPNSKTNAVDVFRAVLADVPTTDHVAIMLGEIDCGFLVWLRSLRSGTSVETELRDSFERYTHFLEEIAGAGFARLLVVTVPPPTVVDYTTWAGLDNARRDVTASITERTDATIRYNSWLREWCRPRPGVDFLDIEDQLLDPTTGLARAELRSPDPEDHHLDRPTFARIVADGLRRLGYR